MHKKFLICPHPYFKCDKTDDSVLRINPVVNIDRCIYFFPFTQASRDENLETDYRITFHYNVSDYVCWSFNDETMRDEVMDALLLEYVEEVTVESEEEEVEEQA